MSERATPSPELAAHILDRMGSTGQPPERGALHVNVATDALLDVLRDEYLRPIRASGRNSTFKLVQAPFGGGKTQFLHCLRELAWTEGFVTALVGLSPRECPFDRPELVYRELALRLELPVEDFEERPRQGLDVVLRSVAEARARELGEKAFLEWVDSEFVEANVESRAFQRAVAALLRAVVRGEREHAEILGDHLRGDPVDAKDLATFRLRERLEGDNAFRWLRSLVQSLECLGFPGVVLLFDEMDRNLSLSVGRRRQIGDNLRQMIDSCGQSQLPGVIWCYAVPPEFLTTIVPEYPALAQRLKGAARFSRMSPLQPIIDLDHLPLGVVELLETLGARLLDLARIAWGHPFDAAIQKKNLRALARSLGELQFETGTRRQFVKACVSMLDAQRREGESALSSDAVRAFCGETASAPPAVLAGEMDF